MQSEEAGSSLHGESAQRYQGRQLPSAGDVIRTWCQGGMEVCELSIKGRQDLGLISVILPWLGELLWLCLPGDNDVCPEGAAGGSLPSVLQGVTQKTTKTFC